MVRISNYGYSEFDPIKGKTKYTPLRISTQRRIKSIDWDKDRPTKKYLNSKGHTILNVINRIKDVCEQQLSLYHSEHGELPEPKELKTIIEIKLDRKKSTVVDSRLVSFIDRFIEMNNSLSTTTKGKVREKQIAKFVTVKNQLEAFESRKKQQLTFQNFSKATFFEFLDFTNDEFKKGLRSSNGYLVNSISKNADSLRSILQKAKKENIEMLIDLDDENLIIKEVPAVDSEVYISEENLLKIINADTLQSKEFINARNYLIICAFTSLRYNDIEHLNEVDVESYNVKGSSFKGFITPLRKNSKADKQIKVCVPVFKPVQDLLNQNGGTFPTFPTNQKLNVQLKKFAKHIKLNEKFKTEKWYYKHDLPIVEKVELNKLVKCHIGRSSFITNLINLGVNKPYIDYITHPTSAKTTSEKYYEKTTLVDRLALFVKDVTENTTSELYRF